MLKSCNICGGEIIPYYPEFDHALKLRKTSFLMKRKHPRKDYVYTFEYEFIVVPNPTISESIKRVKTVTKDISKGGLCFYTQVDHEKGQRINIRECVICSGYTYA